MNNIMLDLETLGTQKDAVILSIGAVFFDKNGIGEKFYSTIDMQSCIDAGFTIDGLTIEWWMEQSVNVRNETFKRNRNIPSRIPEMIGDYSLQSALTSFGSFVDGSSDVKIWGNGSDFDNAMLKNAYDKTGNYAPWRFYNNRCFRTLKNLYPDVSKPESNGTLHNALDDAIWQAWYAIKIINEKGLEI